MRRQKKSEGGTVVITAMVLAVAGVYLGFRTWEVAHTATAAPAITDAPGKLGTVPLVVQAAARDTLLARVEEPERDPFRPPRVERPRVRTKPVVREEPAPVLRMILYDQISPEVQFAVDGVLSGRLKPGQAFEGWTVMSISPRSCIVQKGDKSFTLTPRR